MGIGACCQASSPFVLSDQYWGLPRGREFCIHRQKKGLWLPTTQVNPIPIAPLEPAIVPKW